MATSSQTVTADELFRMPSGKFRYELMRGELRPKSPAGSERGIVKHGRDSLLGQAGGRVK